MCSLCRPVLRFAMSLRRKTSWLSSIFASIFESRLRPNIGSTINLVIFRIGFHLRIFIKKNNEILLFPWELFLIVSGCVRCWPSLFCCSNYSSRWVSSWRRCWTCLCFPVKIYFRKISKNTVDVCVLAFLVIWWQPVRLLLLVSDRIRFVFRL